MRLALIFLALAQASTAPRPLDAFRANYAATKADIDFVLEKGTIDVSLLRDGRIWSDRDIALSNVKTEMEIDGTWACDGTTEYYFSGSADSIVAQGHRRFKESRVKDGYVNLGYWPKAEVLFDGDTLAEHIIDEKTAAVHARTIRAWKTATDKIGLRAKGPFSWWEQPFPYYLNVRYPGVVPEIVHALRGGTATEIEVYTNETRTGWLRLEVAYDPATGYVPRHTRLISFTRGDKTYVKETFVAQTRVCNTGGFVPTEWYIAYFDFDDFESAYLSYNETTVLVPRANVIPADHFKATRFGSRSTPVGMVHLKGVDSVAAVGGKVSLRRTSSSLTLHDIQTGLGRRLTQPARAPRPTIDWAELHEFNGSPTGSWGWILIAGLMVLGFAGFVLRLFRLSSG